MYENVELPLTYRGMKAKERKERATRALERVGMGHRAKHAERTVHLFDGRVVSEEEEAEAAADAAGAA